MSVLRQGAQRLARGEVIILSLVYLYFVVTDQVPLVAFGLIALVWLARWWVTGTLFRFTPLDLPIILLLLCLPVSLWVSTNWSLSLPKVFGVILGIIFFYTVVALIQTRRDLDVALFWLALVCAAVALAGLVGTDWAQGKIISLGFIYDRLPHFIQGIPRSIAGGFSRNGVGGTLTLTVPLLAGLVFASTDRRPAHPDTTHQDRREREIDEPLTLARRWLSVVGGQRSAVILALVLSLITLALTQSRGGILGTAIGVLAVAIWRERRFAWLLAAVAVGLIVIVALGQGNALVEFLLRMDAKSGTLASRLEVWQRGLWMVQDFPFTGIGIGTYNDVAHSLYPFFIAAPDEVVAHAHNNLLQVAVDLGIPGLLAFVGLLAGFVVCAVRAYQATTDIGIHALMAGLLCGMLAHQVFGLTDAFILGTKPGVLLWIFFALAVVAYRMTRGTVAQEAL